MIRLNLIDAAERVSAVDTVRPVHTSDVAGKIKKSGRLSNIIIAAAVVVLGFSGYLSLCGVPGPLQGMLPEAYLNLLGAEDPTLVSSQTSTASVNAEAAARARLKARDALSMKQIVGEVKPQALYAKRASYDAYLPMEKVSYQKAALNQFLQFLSTATPDDVGFSDCIFQAPNYFYLRGVAAKPTSQRSLLERIKTVSTNFKTPALPENAPATDITAFGLFNVNNPNMASVTTFVPAAEVAGEVKALKELAKANKVSFKGLDKPAVENFGVYKRYTYQASTVADYPDMQNFVAALAASPVRIGIEKTEMKLAKKDMGASVSFVLYAAP